MQQTSNFLTGDGTAIGNGANNIGVRMRTRYLRHFRRIFATEVFFLEEIDCGLVDDSCSLFPGVSLAPSPMGTAEMQATFVLPNSIEVFFLTRGTKGVTQLKLAN